MYHARLVKNNIAPLVVILLLAALQQSRFLAIGGINPNLVVIGLAVSAFFAPSFPFYVFMAAMGALVMKSIPAFEYASAAILILALFFWMMRLTTPWRYSLSMLAATAAGSAFFYAIVDYRFLFQHPYLLAYELAYNLIFAATLSLFGTYIYGEER